MFQEFINRELGPSKVEVKFTERAFEDLSSYDKNRQLSVVASIIKRGKTGPLIKPDGVGDPLRGKLSGFTKITLKKMGIRVVYRPTKYEIIEMGIIVVGPRKDEKVYKIAMRRLAQFNKEMSD